jgi:hypothetical protein
MPCVGIPNAVSLWRRSKPNSQLKSRKKLKSKQSQLANAANALNLSIKKLTNLYLVSLMPYVGIPDAVIACQGNAVGLESAAC